MPDLVLNEGAVSAGGTQGSPEFAVTEGSDAGFGYGETAAMAPGSAIPAPESREIIVSGNVEVEADDPAEASRLIVAYVESLGGTVSSRNEWRATPTHPGNANLSVRIPAASLNSAVESLSNFGVVRAVWLNQTDVTAQGADLDARIGALQTSVTRLTDLLANAENTSDLLDVERELSRRQAELDGLRAARADLTGRVQMSTLDISISPTPTAQREAEPYQGFLGGLQRGWRAFVSFIRGFTVVVGAMLPWLIALGVLAAIVTPLVRWWRKRRTLRSERGSVPVVSDYDAEV
jgi:hypothetical protein